MACNTDDIAHVQRPKQSVNVFADPILLDVDLQASTAVLNMKERSFAHAPNGHNTASDSNILRRRSQFFRIGRGEIIKDFRRRVRRLEVVGIYDRPGRLEFRELLFSDFDLLAIIFA